MRFILPASERLPSSPVMKIDRDAHAEPAHVEGEDLGEVDPDRHVEEGLHGADEHDDEDQDDPGPHRIARLEHHRRESDEEMARGREREADDERLPPIDPAIVFPRLLGLRGGRCHGQDDSIGSGVAARPQRVIRGSVGDR